MLSSQYQICMGCCCTNQHHQVFEHQHTQPVIVNIITTFSPGNVRVHRTMHNLSLGFLTKHLKKEHELCDFVVSMLASFCSIHQFIHPHVSSPLFPSSPGLIRGEAAISKSLYSSKVLSVHI